MFAVLLIGVRTDLLGFVQGVTKCMEQGVFFGKLVGPRSVKDCPPPPFSGTRCFITVLTAALLPLGSALIQIRATHVSPTSFLNI